MLRQTEYPWRCASVNLQRFRLLIIRSTLTIVFGCLTCHTRTNRGANGSAYHESKGKPKTYIAGYCSNDDANNNAKPCSNPDCSGSLIHSNLLALDALQAAYA
jgi:hypothetical protein